MTSSADILRTPGLPQAIADGAAALDQTVKDQATIAGLQTSLAAAATQRTADLQKIADLEAQIDPQPNAGRFPGDPGPGKLVVGAIVSGGAGNADAWEKANGAKLGSHRVYFNKGASDLGKPALAFIKAEHTAGRVPVVSVKPGKWADIAAGKYDADFAAFRDACEALPKTTKLIVQHEPQNDLGNLGTAADFRAAQAHIRKVIGTGLKRLSFGGSLMAYGWTPQGLAKFGPVDDWFPGAGVWDWCGIDQYAQTSGGPIEDAKFTAAVASMKAWGVVPAITELGIRAADPTGPAKLKALVDKAIGLGFVAIDWYDSDNNSTGAGWVLTGPLLAQFVALCKDPRAVRPNA